MSSGSSFGPPVRILAETSRRSSRITAVAASSLALAGRESAARPGHDVVDEGVERRPALSSGPSPGGRCRAPPPSGS